MRDRKRMTDFHNEIFMVNLITLHTSHLFTKKRKNIYLYKSQHYKSKHEKK